jgi:small-conductance mechanosensitive channel
MLFDLWHYFPNMVAAFAIIIAGVLLGELLGKIVRISLVKAGLDELFKEAGQIFRPSRLFTMVMQYFVYLLAFTMALTQLGFQTLLLTIIVGSTIAILSLFVFLLIAFGLKNMMPDIFAGMYLRSSGFIKLGETVESGGKRGKVKNIGLIAVTLESRRELTRVPNSLFLGGASFPKRQNNKPI